MRTADVVPQAPTLSKTRKGPALHAQLVALPAPTSFHGTGGGT